MCKDFIMCKCIQFCSLARGFSSSKFVDASARLARSGGFADGGARAAAARISQTGSPRACTRARSRNRLWRWQWSSITCYDEVKTLSSLTSQQMWVVLQVLPVLPLHSWVFMVLKRRKVDAECGSVELLLLGVITGQGNFTFCSLSAPVDRARGEIMRPAEWRRRWEQPPSQWMTIYALMCLPHTQFYLLLCSCRIKPVIPHTPGCWQIGSHSADSGNMINICFLKMMCSTLRCVTEIKYGLWVFTPTDWFAKWSCLYSHYQYIIHPSA